MKVFGVYSNLMFSGLLLSICGLYHLFNKNNSIFPIAIICLIVALLFFKVLVIKSSKIIIYRPFGFLNKYNSIEIDEISKVRIFINTSTGGSVTISFFDKKDKPRLDFLCQFRKFEIKKLVRQLEDIGIATELTGSGAF